MSVGQDGAVFIETVPVPLLFTHTEPDPVAGTVFVETKVPGGSLWRIISVTCRLTTSATVGNRELTLEYRDPGGIIIGRATSPATQAASAATLYAFSVGAGYSFLPPSGVAVGILPAVPLRGDATVRIIVGGADAGDILSEIVYYGEQIPLPA